jgi:GrpB-like predicted nucleotidyltransferase (UPF0157 family)
MSTVRLQAVSELTPQVERLLGRVLAQLQTLLPDAEMHHIGATALPGAMTKGDVDILLRVTRERFPAAVAVLKEHFAIKQPANWTTEFASFGDDNGQELPLGVQVVIKDSSADFLVYLRDYFLANRDALAAYDRLKIDHALEGEEAYWQAKNAFLARILASRHKEQEHLDRVSDGGMNIASPE